MAQYRGKPNVDHLANLASLLVSALPFSNMPNEPIMVVSYILNTNAKWLFSTRVHKIKLALE